MDNNPTQPHLRHNIVVNVMDGAFFGFAVGFASFVTIIPLFVSSMTESAILIGLIPAIHAVGWQFPQLFIANRVSRLRRFKPMVMWNTIQERLPFLGLAAVAWWLPSLDKNIALTLTFLLLIWQGLGAGFTANPWQNMIAKIIPSDIRGTFFGAQAAAANLLASLSAVLAGLILDRVEHPQDYVYCFLLACLNLAIGYLFLGATREQERSYSAPAIEGHSFWRQLPYLVRKEPGFLSFLVMRSLLSFATLAFAFYTVYAVRFHHISEISIGVMTGVLLGTQIIANPVMGWLGDRLGHRTVIEAGVIACIASAGIAWLAPHPNWFYLVFILTGIGNVAVWTIGMAMALEFGNEAERPAFIGLANTLVAPSTILAPFMGGWLADIAGYPATFAFSIACGILTLVVLNLVKRRRPGQALANL
jgi:MFS family permease